MANLANTVKDSPAKAIDPVCGMDVQPGGTKLVSVHEGRSYWFCAEACYQLSSAITDIYS
jgi:YHS domain-containing protein